MQIFKLFPDDDMEAYVVSKEVNSPVNYNPELIREII